MSPDNDFSCKFELLSISVKRIMSNFLLKLTRNGNHDSHVELVARIFPFLAAFKKIHHL